MQTSAGLVVSQSLHWYS